MNWIDRIDQLNVLVLGDIMVDRYITGTVDRVSPGSTGTGPCL